MKISLDVVGLTTGYRRKSVSSDLTLRPLSGGKVVGILGPNASGKSTLLKTIAGVQPALGGSVEIRRDGRVLDRNEIRQTLGYVPQDLPTSAALTALETVIVAARRYLPASQARQRAAEVLCELGIGHLAHRYLGGLSGGQRQLIAVAQTMAGQPSVILLDEPTSALDLHRQFFLLDYLRTITRNDNALTLVALHDINLAARYCDELVVIRDGQLVAQGAPHDVVTSELLRDTYNVDTDILYYEGAPVVVGVSR